MLGTLLKEVASGQYLYEDWVPALRCMAPDLQNPWSPRTDIIIIMMEKGEGAWHISIKHTNQKLSLEFQAWYPTLADT